MHRNKSRKWAFRLMYAAFLFVLIIITGEVFVRFAGFKPWQKPVRKIRVEPYGSLFVADSLLGYRGRPGRLRVTLDDELEFTMSHDSNGFRVNPAGVPDSAQSSTWCLGGSFTHGYGVNDDETFVNILQSRFPETEFRNLGMSGFGSLQCLLNLKDLCLQEGCKLPGTVIYGYGSFHNQRNTVNRYWKKALSGSEAARDLVFPRVSIINTDDPFSVSYHSIEYHPFPLQEYSALSHFLEQQYDHWEENGLNSGFTTEQILIRMNRFCNEKQIRFVVAGVSKDTETLKTIEKLKEIGIEACDISVDLEDLSLRILPDDGHPNAAAHRRMAGQLAAYLSRNNKKDDKSQNE